MSPLLNDGEAFHGYIHSIDDALLLVEAVRHRLVPRIYYRLTDSEQLSIRSGSVFVWHEDEANIKRWTELSNSKKLVYGSRQKVTSSTRGGSHPRGVTHGSSTHVGGLVKQLSSTSSSSSTSSTPQKDFFRKKTISVRTRKNEKFHLVNYYYDTDVKQGRLLRPSQCQEFKHLHIEPGFYLTGLDSTPLMITNASDRPHEFARALSSAHLRHPPSASIHPPPPPPPQSLSSLRYAERTCVVAASSSFHPPPPLQTMQENGIPSFPKEPLPPPAAPATVHPVSDTYPAVPSSFLLFSSKPLTLPPSPSTVSPCHPPLLSVDSETSCASASLLEASLSLTSMMGSGHKDHPPPPFSSSKSYRPHPPPPPILISRSPIQGLCSPPPSSTASSPLDLALPSSSSMTSSSSFSSCPTSSAGLLLFPHLHPSPTTLSPLLAATTANNGTHPTEFHAHATSLTCLSPAWFGRVHGGVSAAVVATDAPRVAMVARAAGLVPRHGHPEDRRHVALLNRYTKM